MSLLTKLIKKNEDGSVEININATESEMKELIKELTSLAETFPNLTELKDNIQRAYDKFHKRIN